MFELNLQDHGKLCVDNKDQKKRETSPFGDEL